MHLPYAVHLLSAVGGPIKMGPGIAGYSSWIVAAVVVAFLITLAWWTMRPARRATRAEIRRGRRVTAADPREPDDSRHDRPGPE